MTLDMVKAIMQEVQNKENEESIDKTLNLSVTVEDREENKKKKYNDIDVTKKNDVSV